MSEGKTLYKGRWDLSGYDPEALDSDGRSGSYYEEEEVAESNADIVFEKIGNTGATEDITINHSISRINRKYLSSHRNGYSDHEGELGVSGKFPMVIPSKDDEALRDAEYNPENDQVRWLGKKISMKEIHDSKSRHVVMSGSPTADVETYVRLYARRVLQREIPALKNVELVLYLKFSEKAKNKLDKLRNVFVGSQISREHVNEEALYKWIIKHQDRVLIITEGWDSMVTAVNETRQCPIEYEGSGSSIQILQKLSKGDIFGKSWLLTFSNSLEFQLKGDFRPSKVVILSDKLTEDVSASMWMHVVCNRIFSRKISLQDMNMVFHKLMHGAYTATMDGSGHFKLQESRKEWSITKHLDMFTFPVAFKTKAIFKDVPLKGIRFKEKKLQHFMCALYVARLPLGQFYDIVDNDFAGATFSQLRHFVYGILLDSNLRRLLEIIMPNISDLDLRTSALLGRLSRKMRVIDMRLIRLLCDCGDGVDLVIQHHIRMFIMKSYVSTDDMYYIAKVLSKCNKLHRLQFTNCDLLPEQLDAFKNAMGRRKIPVEVVDVSFNPQVTCTTLGHVVANYDVTELVLQECNLTRDQLYALANGLRRVTQNLKVIDLRWNIIEDEHVNPIIKVIRFLSGMLYLSARYRRWDIHPDVKAELDNAIWKKPLNKQNIHIEWAN